MPFACMCGGVAGKLKLVIMVNKLQILQPLPTRINASASTVAACAAAASGRRVGWRDFYCHKLKSKKSAMLRFGRSTDRLVIRVRWRAVTERRAAYLANQCSRSEYGGAGSSQERSERPHTEQGVRWARCTGDIVAAHIACDTDRADGGLGPGSLSTGPSRVD